MPAVMRRAFGALCAVAIVMAIAACTDAKRPSDSPAPTPKATPVFSSDEEALAAAKKAYAEYLKVSDEIAHDGGKDPERLKDMVSAKEYRDQVRVFKQFVHTASHSSGNTSFDTASLQKHGKLDGREVVNVYLCSDVSKVRIMDANGNDVTPENRANRLPLIVSFRVDSDRKLLLTESKTWSGQNFC